MVLDLQVKLKRAEEALKVAQEAATIAENLAYEWGVQETETRLTVEVTAVYREYCAVKYSQAFDRAGIPADSDMKRTDQVYYLENLREEPTPSPPVTIPPPPNEPLSAQKPCQESELPIGVEKEKKQEKEKEKAKEKEKEKKKEQDKADINPSEDALTIRDMVSKVKIAGFKSKIDFKKDSQQP